MSVMHADDRQIDVEDKGSLDKAQVISALQSSGDADYDSVSFLNPPVLVLILILGQRDS